MARYRVLHYVPDPFTGARVPVAAMVDTGAGVKLARARAMPLACLGDARHLSHIDFLLSHIERVATDVGKLPPIVGPHFALGEERVTEVEQPVEWVIANVLPSRPRREKVTVTGDQQRATRGFNLFIGMGLADVVEKTFEPQKDGAKMFAFAARSLPQISHWVNGDKQIMLMEPIDVAVSDRRLNNDVRKVSAAFSQYTVAMERREIERNRVHTVAYVLGTGMAQDRRTIENVTSDLKMYADEVLDMTVPEQRQRLYGEIRYVAAGSQLDIGDN